MRNNKHFIFKLSVAKCSNCAKGLKWSNINNKHENLKAKLASDIKNFKKGIRYVLEIY